MSDNSFLIGIDGSRAFINARTGTENYSYQLLKNIALADKDNSYLVYLRPGQNPGKSWPVNFRFRTLNYPRLWTQVGLSLATFTDAIDVLFIPSHTLPLVRRPGLKTVITVHDLGAEYLPFTHQLKQILYLKLMTHYQLQTATKIIAVSEATKRDLVKKAGLRGEKISVIYEDIDKKVFRKLSIDILRDILNKYKLRRKKYFLFVGTIQPRNVPDEGFVVIMMQGTQRKQWFIGPELPGGVMTQKRMLSD
jgi:glycosyltransferase involved in cell wall biosynthesis